MDKHKDIKRTALRRLKIIEGQLRGLEHMIEKDVYCIDILHQSMAVKSALSSIEDLILEKHLLTHVIEQIKSGKEAKSVRETLDIYKLAKRK